MNDFSDWNDLNIPVSGITKKLWLSDENGIQKGIFKFGDQWTEQIAKDLANLFLIPCMECEYGTYNGFYGTMCYDIGNIIEMGDMYTAALSEMDVTYTLIELHSKLTNQSTFISILKMFVFDFVIGNRDRHSGNFALDYNGNLSPLYDNASSLCYGLDDKRASKLKMNENDLLIYSLDIMSQVRIPNRCTNLELMYHLKSAYPEVWKSFINDFLSINTESIKSVIYNFNGIVHQDIIYCIYFGVIKRLEYLERIEEDE